MTQSSSALSRTILMSGATSQNRAGIAETKNLGNQEAGFAVCRKEKVKLCPTPQQP